uniref:signal peptidase I n=3 Tax=Peptoniphilaceae TaxID=1570339 RepID=UPI0037367D9D
MMDNSKTNKKEFLDSLKTFIIVLAIALIFRLFVFNFTTVKGHSMDDTLKEKDLLLVDKIGTNFRNYERGDIVILDAPDVAKKLYVKRIVGLPGEKIDLIDGSFYIN